MNSREETHCTRSLGTDRTRTRCARRRGSTWEDGQSNGRLAREQGYAPLHIANYTQSLVPPRAHSTQWLRVIALIVRALLRALVVRRLYANIRGDVSPCSFGCADVGDICRVLYVKLQGDAYWDDRPLWNRGNVPPRHARN